jgi:hypothetical protein
MKFPALLLASVALAACSSTQTEESAATPLSPADALDVAATPDAAPKIVPAKSEPEINKTPSAANEAAEASIKPNSADATCNRGTLDEVRSFIICEDGALRKAGVMAALSAPHDPALKIEDVAASYEVPSQIFTGIENATYGTLINSERKTPRPRGKSKPQTGLVQIEGKIYEVYQLSTVGKTGTIFVEKKDAKAQ